MINTDTAHSHLEMPSLTMTDGVLRSARHGDIYFSNDGGLAESRYVFLDGTGLPELLQNCDHITIAETGFGTGLNFLALIDLYRAVKSTAKIDFISFEAIPPDLEHVAFAHQPFEAIAPLSEMLRSVWPPRWPGVHHRFFEEDNIHLHLHYGLADKMMAGLDFEADIWFLDGFSPAKNTSLWSETVFSQIGRLSKNGAKLATFTVARAVREGLASAGFQLEKRPGFGRKRDMLVAERYDKALGAPYTPPEHTLILGGGIAGASVAAGLRQSGLSHHMLESGPQLASAASGNPAGLQSPRLRATDQPAGRLSVSALSYARLMAEQTGAVQSRGAVLGHLAEKEAERQAKLADQGWPADLMQLADSHIADAALGLDSGLSATLQAAAQVILPPRLVAGLAADSPVSTGQHITSISGQSGDWQVKTQTGQVFEGDHLVLAAGSDLPNLLSLLPAFSAAQPLLPLQVTTGQLSLLPRNNPLSQLKTAFHYGGYILPPIAGQQVMGASFDHGRLEGVRDAAHLHNHGLLPPTLAKLLPAKPENWKGRVSYRLATSDRQPLMGDYLPTISLCSALGAHGLTLGPLLGLALAMRLAGRPDIMDRAIYAMLSPLRFQRRANKKAGR
ncbi:MAG: tRNA (5-methylaminomethyl-2-thiouridine)(34)-methyltransferase MnmD [Candidatus Puniceispirillaceae bacterium]